MPLLDVPVIDIQPFLEGDPRGKERVARAVDQACRDIGFLVITGHGVDPALCNRIIEVSRTFFDLPPEEKLQVKRPAPHVPRGYTPVADEALAYSLDKTSPGDLKEAFTIGPLEVPDDPYYTCEAAAPHFAANLWPQRPSDLREVWSSYYRVLERLGADIMRIFARALQLPEDFFDDKIDKHTSALRVLNYPDQPEAPLPGQLRAGAHSDYGTLTIVRHEDDPGPGGLQVQNRNGEWVDVPEVPNSFIVNIGDMMMHWTNDQWVSTMHRVVNPPASAALASRRISVVFFHQTNYDAVIECLPSCAGPDNPPKYPPVRYGDWLLMKYTKTTTFGEGAAAAS